MSVAQKLHAAGFTGLVSVTPPDAQMTQNSRIAPDQRGKVPGKRSPDGWHGYRWSKEDVDPKLIDEWGANIGLRAEQYPGLDVDSEDPGLTLFVKREAETFLGPAPARQSRAPRLLLMYRAEEPIKKQALTVVYRGQSHTIELLAKGQQYLVHGAHPSGSRYRWGGTFPRSPEELTLITEDKARGFMHHLARLLEGQGLDVEVIGAGRATGPADPVPEIIIHGARDVTMASIVGTFRQRGLSKDAALAAALIENEARCRPPLERYEVEKVVDSIYTNYAGGTLDVRSTADEDFGPLAEPPEDSGELEMENANDMLDEEPKEQTWLVEGLIPDDGASMIVAKPKVGKSTVARALAVAVARGDESFMGRRLNTHGHVFYISFKGEGTRKSIHRELHKLTGGRKEVGRLHIFCDKLAPGDILSRVKRSVKKHKPVLVVIDTFQALAQVKDINDYSMAAEKIKPLLELAGDGHILFVHHSPKNAIDGDMGSMVQGSTVLYGLMESAVAVWRDKDDRRVRFLMAEGREVELEPVVMNLNPETHEPTLGRTRKEMNEMDADGELVARLNAAGGEMKLRDLTHGRDSPAVEASLNRLLTAGALVQEGTGKPYDAVRVRVVTAFDDFTGEDNAGPEQPTDQEQQPEGPGGGG